MESDRTCSQEFANRELAPAARMLSSELSARNGEYSRNGDVVRPDQAAWAVTPPSIMIPARHDLAAAGSAATLP
jgi:hypothetical protein